MRLLIPILLNCILVLAIYLADRHTPAKNLPYMTKQLIVGALFGVLSAFASDFGVHWLGTVVNVRDAAPLSAGLIFGAPAGIISGVIGGMYRWFSVYWGGGMYTRLACSIATILAGFMSAGLRKLMFDNKKPTWGYGICIAVVCEVVHMILIFLTNLSDSAYAFEFVKGATTPMVFGNAAAVGCAILLVSLLSRERIPKKKGKERIAHTFQRWLLTCIVIAFLATSSFTFMLQNSIIQVETEALLNTAMNDVEADIMEKSNEELLAIARKVKQDYERDPNCSLAELTGKYGIQEINVVNPAGMIINSNVPDVINRYDMNSKEQSKEFMDMLKQQDEFVQKYGPMGKDESEWRKYAAVKLADGGFIQVGYDADQFHQIINAFVVDVTKNRHVGAGGFVAVCDDQFRIVMDNEYSGRYIADIGITPKEEMERGENATKLYDAEVFNDKTNESASYMYIFKFVEGYCIIAAMPESEAMLMRDASLYTSIFMQVLIFAALIVFIYILIKRVIINSMQKINDTLGRITEGDLDVTVDVRSSQEFSSLSDDINSTVATLKRYIAEAAARIDKELEYAKQIQLAALPTNFPKGEDYSVYAQMIAAKEVGGDFYDFYKINETTVAFMAADVSGKGIPAAMFMMTAKTTLKDLAERGIPVNDIFTRANEKLCENNEADMFVTAWMGVLDLKTGNLQFANAGHNPPLLKHADGSFEYLRARAGFVLAGIEGFTYRLNEIQLQPGDRLFLYTDGVTEATNIFSELYGEERLLAFMNQNASLEAEKLLPALKANIDEFVGEAPQFDDMTMVLFDFKPLPEETLLASKTFSADTQTLPEVLALVEETLESCECSMKIQTALCMAIEEVFVNIANYAYGEESGDATLHIGFREKTREVIFRMSDRGMPFDPLQKPDPDITLSLKDRQIGGLGIFMVKKTMDSVQYAYKDNQNILTMIKKI